MDTKKIKNGVSVKEIEGFVKKHRFKLFFCSALALSCLFNFIFFAGWGATFASIGGILGVIFPHKIAPILKKTSAFFCKQEEITQLILALTGLILSIFLPILTFLLLGLSGGMQVQKPSKDTDSIEIEETE